ncbi:MAG: tetratricopeptide repeat protein [Deltaproteobacteria bacterium]|nr:tetratricopeptide repeat protein [Candidatus Anaeroferrophillacea bacterium]
MYRKLLPVAVLCLLVLAPAAVHAGSPPADRLMPAWEHFLAACEGREITAIDHAFDRLLRIHAETECTNATRFSRALILLADRAYRRQDAAGAAMLMEKAYRLSPAAAFVPTARAVLQARTGRPFKAPGFYLQALRATAESAWNRLPIAAAAAGAGAWAVRWTAFWFLLALLFRYLNMFAEHLEHRWGSGAGRWLPFPMLLLSAAAMLPEGMFNAAAILLLAPTAAWLNHRERLAAVLVIALLAVGPYLGDRRDTMFAALGHPFLNAAERLNTDAFDADDLRLVAARPDRLPGRRLKYFSLGTALQRQGDYREAIAAYSRLLDDGTAPSPAVCNNLANLHFMIEDNAAAIDLYRQAIKGNPGNGIYHYNLNHALIKDSFSLQESEASFIQAWELSPDIIARQMAREKGSDTQMLINEPLPVNFIAAYIDGEGHAAASCRYPGSRYGRPADYVLLAGMLILLVAGWRREPLRFCPVCGTGTALSGRRLIVCPACLITARGGHESHFRRHLTRMRTIVWLWDRVGAAIGLVLPGFYQVITGRSWSGLVLLASFGFATALQVIRLLTTGGADPPPLAIHTLEAIPLLLFLVFNAVHIGFLRHQRRQLALPRPAASRKA